MSAEQVGSYTGLATGAIGILASILAIVNHKRIRSNCCGNKIEVSMDVEATTPGSPKDLRIKIPVKLDDELKSDIKTG
jgi:hypothetical protein